MPPAVAGQLDAVLAGNLDLSDGIGLDDAAGMLGGLLGGRRRSKFSTEYKGKPYGSGGKITSAELLLMLLLTSFPRFELYDICIKIVQILAGILGWV